MFRRIRKKERYAYKDRGDYFYVLSVQLTNTLNTNRLNYAYFVQLQTDTVVEQSSRELSY